MEASPPSLDRDNATKMGRICGYPLGEQAVAFCFGMSKTLSFM